MVVVDRSSRMFASLLLVAVLLALVVVQALVFAPSATAKEFANCAALNTSFKGGVAKSKAAQKRAVADGVKYTPTVNAKAYAQNASKDRDKDGVACEQ